MRLWTFMAVHQKIQIQLHFCGNSVQIFPSPRDFRGFRGIPVIPIPVQVSTSDHHAIEIGTVSLAVSSIPRPSVINTDK